MWGARTWRRGLGEEIRREEATRSGLMARIKHPADVFSGAWSVESRSELLDGMEGREIFPKDVNTNEG